MKFQYLAAPKTDIGAKLGQIYIHTFRAVTSSAAETEMKGWKTDDFLLYFSRFFVIIIKDNGSYESSRS